MATINVKDCTFSDHAAVVQHMEENNYYSWTDCENELKSIGAKFDCDSSMKKAIDELTAALHTRNRNSVGNTIKNHFGEFLSGTFAGLASSALMEFIKSFFNHAHDLQ